MVFYMTTKERLELLLRNNSKLLLSSELKISRPTLDKYLTGIEPEKHEVKMRIDFLYYKNFVLEDISDGEILKLQNNLLENQYLIDPREEFVFKDYVKKMAFGSYELETTSEVSESSFRMIADGGDIEKDIGRKKFLEMVNLYSLTLRILKDVSMGRDITINEAVVREWHYALMQGVRADAGEYSTKMRIIENSSIETTHPLQIYSEMNKWAKKSAGIKNLSDIAQSHALFEKIHPFGDGNGRIGRLIMAVQCIKAGFVPPLINKDNASLYYASLEATQSGKKINAMAAFLAKSIEATAKSLPLLPKGLKMAKERASGFLKYGYNSAFIELAKISSPDIIEAFYTYSMGVSLNTLKSNAKAINELTLEFAFGSSRIEGSTFNKLDTKKFLEMGYFPDYKYDEDDEDQKEIDKQMAINNKKVFEEVLLSTPKLTVETICKLHDIIVSNIKGQDSKGITNEARSVNTQEGLYIPLVGKDKIEKTLESILNMASEIKEPFAKSFFLHLNIAYLQPFDDGNKRTARAVANIPLVEANIVPFTYDNILKDKYNDIIGSFYESGDSVDKMATLVLKSYEKQIETMKYLTEAESIDTAIAELNGFKSGSSLKL